MQLVHFEILAEEPSMELFLREVLPKIFKERATFAIHTHQGKADLLRKLAAKLRAYAKWLPGDTRVVVLIDRDDDDCTELKLLLDRIASESGLRPKLALAPSWNIVNRVAIEELEAWFFGDWDAVRLAYPRIRANIIAKEAYRFSDGINGGTWEALERVFKQHGYFSGGLRKAEAAQAIGIHFEPTRCSSPSFRKLHSALVESLEPNPA